MTCRKQQHIRIDTVKLHSQSQLPLWLPLMVATHIWVRRNPNSYFVVAEHVQIIAPKICLLPLWLLFSLGFWSYSSAVPLDLQLLSTLPACIPSALSPVSGLLLNTTSYISLHTTSSHSSFLLLLVSLKPEEEQAGVVHRLSRQRLLEHVYLCFPVLHHSISSQSVLNYRVYSFMPQLRLLSIN